MKELKLWMNRISLTNVSITAQSILNSYTLQIVINMRKLECILKFQDNLNLFVNINKIKEYKLNNIKSSTNKSSISILIFGLL